MRMRGTAAARAAEVECAEMDETVAEYVVAGGVAPPAVLPVPSCPAPSVGGQENSGVSDVYSRTLAGARAMVGAGRATMSCYVGKVESGPGRNGDATAAAGVPSVPLSVQRDVPVALSANPCYPHSRAAPRSDVDMRGTEWEDADSGPEDNSHMLTWSPIRTPYDDESTWDPAPCSLSASAPAAADTASSRQDVRTIEIDPTANVRTQHIRREAGGRMSQSRIPFFPNVIPDNVEMQAAPAAATTQEGSRFTALGSRTESASVAAERVTRAALTTESAGTRPDADGAVFDSAADEAVPGVCCECGYVGEAAGCTFGRATCAAAYCPSCRSGRECGCEEDSDEGAESHAEPIRWRTVPMPVEVRMLDALLEGSNGLLVRCVDDPSVTVCTRGGVR